MSETAKDNGNDSSARQEFEGGLTEATGLPQPEGANRPRKVLRFIRGRFHIQSNGRVHILPHRVSRRLNLPEEVEVIDPRFRRYSYSYLVQAFLATAAMLIILLFVDSISDAALAAGLGSSVVILFVHPSSSVARPRSVIGGHSLALAVGMGCSLLVFASPMGGFIEASRIFSDLSLAVSVGVLILMMALTNTEHPPAAGTVLGMSLQPLEPVRLIVFIVAVIMLAVIQYWLRSHLHDLI